MEQLRAGPPTALSPTMVTSRPHVCLSDGADVPHTPQGEMRRYSSMAYYTPPHRRPNHKADCCDGPSRNPLSGKQNSMIVLVLVVLVLQIFVHPLHTHNTTQSPAIARFHSIVQANILLAMHFNAETGACNPTQGTTHQHSADHFRLTIHCLLIIF